MTFERSRVEAQLLLAGEVLRRERLVDLDEIELVERQPGALERLADGRRRAHAHQRRLDADRRPRHDAARAASGRGLGGRLAEAMTSAAAPSTMPLALPAVTTPSFLNTVGSVGQALERRLGPQVVVALDERDALARLDLDRHDFLGHHARRPGRVRQLLAAQRVRVRRPRA